MMDVNDCRFSKMSVRRRRLSAYAVSGLAFLLAACSSSNQVEPAAPAAPVVTAQIHGGTYTLTITASQAAGPCAPTFPPVARRRVYTARVEERYISGTHRLEVFLSGADFVTSRAFFFGIASAMGEIRFSIQDASQDPWWPFPSEPDVVERLGDGNHLMVIGEISATRTGDTISGRGELLNHSSDGQCAIESFEMVRT